MMTPIRGKVARMLNDLEIAINVGTANGVTIGMLFDVVDTAFQEILDPDTKEVLGSFDRSIVRVKVTHVQEKVAIATKYRYQSESVKSDDSARISPVGPFARALMSPGSIEQYVETGDPVVQVIEKSKEEGRLLKKNEDDSDIPF